MEEETNPKVKKKKIDLVPRHRFQKDDINVKRESIKKRCQSANKFKNANSSRVKSATEGKEEEIKMIYNTNHNVDVIATKANKNPLVLNGSKTSKVGNIGNPALFEKFEETLQKMQNELNKKNSQPPKQIENDVKKETIKKEDYNEEEEEHEVIEQPKLDFNKKKVDDNNINEIENDINSKFNDLNDLDNYMKKLDMMLDNSKQKSMKMQYDLDFNHNEEKLNDYSDEDDLQKEDIKPENHFTNIEQEHQINYKKPIQPIIPKETPIVFSQSPIKESNVNFARSYNDDEDYTNEPETNYQYNNDDYCNDNNDQVLHSGNFNSNYQTDNHINNVNEISFKNISHNKIPTIKEPEQQPIQYNNNYNDDLYEDEQPKKLNNVIPVPTYMAPPQTKTIQIQRNVIDVSKKKAKCNIDQQMSFEPIPKENNYFIPQSNQNVVKEDPMNYIKNLLEKTKSEIDNLTNNFDDDSQQPFNVYKGGLY